MTDSGHIALASTLAARHAHHHHRLALLVGIILVAAIIALGIYAWRHAARRRRSRPAEPKPPADPHAKEGERALLYRIGLVSARHRGFVVIAWLLVLAGVVIGSRVLVPNYADDFSLPGTSAQQGADLLQAHRSASAGGQSGYLVFDTASVTRDSAAIEQSMTNVRKLPDVLAASDPLKAVARNGRIAYATVHFAVNPQQLGRKYVAKVTAAVAPARQAGVSVNYGGQLGAAAKLKSRDIRSEVIGLVVAFVVLLLGFGSVYAAGLPIASALAGAFAGLSVLGMIATTAVFPQVSPTLAIMMGLGVGIDYALFLSTRHRQLVLDGVEPAEAAARSLAASGHAVLVAAATVIIALLGLYASGLSFIGKLGLAAGITVAVAALSAITVVPALLAFAGRSIDRFRIRRPVAEASGEHQGWQRYAELVGRHPWRCLAAGLAVLAVLTIPAFSMRLGHVDASADPAGSTAKVAYQELSEGWGPGANGTFTVVAQLGPDVSNMAGGLPALKAQLRTQLLQTADVAQVSPVKTTPDGALIYATVLPKTGPQAGATDTLMHTLQDDTLPSVLFPSDSKGSVTGSLAGQLQFRDVVRSRLPYLITVVILAAFALLLIAFRSPVLALKAGVLNLLSIGAAWGIIVAVFQWGWGSRMLGVSEKVPIESYVPMMIFAIVFGLSMDYEVFLLSRIREAWLATGDNQRSVARGLAGTGRVITCAALIMASVFAAFLMSTNPVVKMLALGLGLSVLVDASVIRLLVVPASMFLLGRYNWWSPRWLEVILPRRTSATARRTLGQGALAKL